MNKLIAVLVLVLCITTGATYAAATIHNSSEKVLPLTEENGNIILAANASYVESGAQYYYDNSTGQQIHVWDIPDV